MENDTTYSRTFVDVLKKEFSEDDAPFQLRKKISMCYSGELSIKFPGKKNIWLSKEISKWKKKVLADNHSFKPTLQNLNTFCTLTEKTPNEVLLPDLRYIGPGQIQFLSEKTLENLLGYLHKKGNLAHNFIVPVLYAPEKMVVSFLSVYKKRQNNSEEIHASFLISDIEQCAEENPDEYPAGISSYSVQRGDHNISVPSKNNMFFHEMYTRMKAEFQSAVTDLDDNYLDVFYRDHREWIENATTEGDALCQYFPLPPIKKPLQPD